MPIEPLPANSLRRKTDPRALGFKTTADLEPAGGLIGQDRALDALHFGVAMRARGYNIYALGAQGSGRHNAIRRFVEARAKAEPAAIDWIYLHNFDEPHRPRALAVPTGRAAALAAALDALVDQLKSALPAVFESEDYRTRRQAIDQAFQQEQQDAFQALSEKAERQGLKLIPQPKGMVISPVRNGEPISSEILKRMPKVEREAIEANVAVLMEELSQVMRTIPQKDKERRDKIRNLDRETAELAIDRATQDCLVGFDDIPELPAHLERMGAHIIDNAQVFLGDGQGPEEPLDQRFNKYRANALVRNAADCGAPVVYADSPDIGHLLGRIEHVPHMGAMLTDFTLIKRGALHEANGGYLLLDASRLLAMPLAWHALKRCLRSREIAIESPLTGSSTMTAVTLEPEPIPLNVKVVLFGERQTLNMLAALDLDFGELFKVAAEFDDTIERNDASEIEFCRLIAGIARDEIDRPVDAGGCAAIIDRASRMTGDSERISLKISLIADLIREADYWAQQSKAKTIGAKHVVKAVGEQIRRVDLVREKVHEQVTRDTIMIDTEGSAVGQINGLSVLQTGAYAFGKPSRITARVRMGAGKVVDIEREVDLGGALHSKGVLILSGFLAARYATDVPVSMAASLVFEQSYGGVDGDSASSTELYALLSALAEVPIRQGLAVTGSVNQSGEVQAIGGVNEKIEGYFDICRANGLTGDQGVLIPAANVVHLMLRDDVVAACKKGKFHIHAVRHIDEGIELLTGMPAGNRDEDGAFPEGCINRLVEDRLTEFALTRHRFGNSENDETV